jgi:ubiquinone biosynthesis protein
VKRLSQIWRLMHINFVLIRHGLDKIVLSIPPFAPVRFIAYLNPFNWVEHDKRSRGERIRTAFEELGPIFVKFGQMLSTRRDILPDDVAEELSRLQDQVPPFEGATAVVEKVYGRRLNEVFLEFSEKPFASASVAQVHAAKFFDGKEVVVKVLRPHIKKIIRRDIDLLYLIAGLIERYWSQGPRLHPKEIVVEFERTIFDELDLLREAANASQLRRNFAGSTIIYVPEVYWEYSHEKVMVMERIYGIPIADMTQLRARGVDFKKLSERGVEIFFTQVFRDCFFHADMHPGNIFVCAEDPSNPRYMAVDFGIMGSLTPRDQRYLAENLLAFFKRDYRRVAELHVESGWVSYDTRIDEFESAIRAVCEPIFERPLKDISFGQMLLRLFQTSRRFNMEVQPQLMLLQKTLLNIEGLGRELYPDLDLWNTAKPFLEKWLKKQIGPRALWRKICENAPYWSEQLPEIPGLIYETLFHLKESTFRKEQALASHRIERTAEKRAKVANRRRGFLEGILFVVIVYLGWYFWHRGI